MRQAQMASGGYGFGARANELLGSHASPELLELARNGACATNPRVPRRWKALGLLPARATATTWPAVKGSARVRCRRPSS